MPQGPAPCIKKGAVLVVMVTVVGIEVTGDNVLEVSVLPVQVTGLNGPCEHSPVGAHLCRRRRGTEVRRRRCEEIYAASSLGNGRNTHTPGHLVAFLFLYAHTFEHLLISSFIRESASFL